MLILSEFQEGLHNARVYKTTNGGYGVVVYDAESDYEEFKAFLEIQSAEEYAEDWVTKNVSI